MSIDDAEFRLHQGDLYRLVYARTRDHAVSEDVVQDSYVRLMRYRGSTSVANIGAMLRTIAGNLVRDHVRGRRRRGEEPLSETFELVSDTPSPEDVLLQRERVKMIGRILDDMPPLRRDVFLRRRLHGQSAREVATALAITPAAVDTHVARAVLALHKASAELDRIENAA